MKVTIEKTIKEEIDIDFPYYYKQVLTEYEYDDFNVIYGKILPENSIAIHKKIGCYGSEITFEVEQSERMATGYFKKEYIATKEEFDSVLKEAIEFISKIK